MEVGKILCGCVQLYSNLMKHNDYYRTLALCRATVGVIIGLNLTILCILMIIMGCELDFCRSRQIIVFNAI